LEKKIKTQCREHKKIFFHDFFEFFFEKGNLNFKIYMPARRGLGYADVDSSSAEGGSRRGAIPRAALGIAYTDDQNRLRLVFPALGISTHSCSDACVDEASRAPAGKKSFRYEQQSYELPTF
jgi:hypothetical protein